MQYMQYHCVGKFLELPILVRRTLLFVYKYEFTQIEKKNSDHKRFKKSPPPSPRCVINLLYGSLLSCFYKIIAIPMDTTPPP